MIIVDRFEGSFAILSDNGSNVIVHRTMIADNVKEGDAVYFENGLYRKDKTATKKRSKGIKDLFDSLRR